MRPTTRHAVVGALALAALTAPAAAGTITGTIRQQASGAALGSAEVRVWNLTLKGWRILGTTTANASGVYSLTVPGGTYKLDARGPANGGGNWGDRWYDVAAPNASGGYVGEDADELTVGAAQTLAGIDVSLEVLGGADGTVLRAGNVPLPNVFVRMERRGDPRVHHNDLTKTLPAGLVSMRGLLPRNDYQLLVYDPSGVRDTLLQNGPYAVTSNANGSLGNLTMVDAPADPYEGNNAAACAVGFDSAPLHLDPPQPWQSQGATRIGPTNPGDVDWYCFTAVAGDRLFVSTSTEFTWNGVTRPHPWTDPMLSFWRGARGAKLAEDDDSGPGLDARLDTGPLTAGCHCIAVTAFGDANFVGASQGSSGRYSLRVVMGNRPPVVSIKKGPSEVPAAPAIVQMDEGDTLDLVLGYSDADHDVPTRSFSHVDSADADVAGGVLVLGAGGGTYRWTAPAGSQAGSPYELRLRAADGEFTMEKLVIVAVNGVNRPPAVPVPVMPIGGEPVMTGAPTLTWANAADPEAEPLRYDVELYAGDTDAPPIEVVTVDEGGGGMTSWTPSTLAENTRASWRVRARDGHPNGLSPWSPFATFLVDVTNDAPEVPLLVKPADGEVVTVRRPGLAALDVLDPEDDGVEMVFELAADREFAQIIWTSDPVPMDAMGVTTMAATGVDLSWGDDYYARVRAVDERGAMSDWSDVHRFRLTQNVPPTTPSFAEACVAATYTEEPPAAIVVTNVVDHEREPITFEVQFFTPDVDPNTAIPVYRATAPMDTTSTTTAIPVDLSSLANGTYRYRVRAHDGTSPSDWIDCELTLDLVEAEAGGCCDAGSRPAASLLPALVLAAFALRRRRRAAA